MTYPDYIYDHPISPISLWTLGVVIVGAGTAMGVFTFYGGQGLKGPLVWVGLALAFFFVIRLLVRAQWRAREEAYSKGTKIRAVIVDRKLYITRTKDAVPQLQLEYCVGKVPIRVWNAVPEQLYAISPTGGEIDIRVHPAYHNIWVPESA